MGGAKNSKIVNVSKGIETATLSLRGSFLFKKIGKVLGVGWASGAVGLFVEEKTRISPKEGKFYSPIEEKENQERFCETKIPLQQALDQKFTPKPRSDY